MSVHQSVWLATAPRPSFPPLAGDLEVDVAVVGGGITGLTTALLLQRDGARVALVEADRIGAGTSGATTGKVTSQHGLVYSKLIGCWRTPGCRSTSTRGRSRSSSRATMPRSDPPTATSTRTT